MKITAYLFMVLLCIVTPAKAMTMADLFAALKEQRITKLDTLQAKDSERGIQSVHDRFYPVLTGALSYEKYNSPTNLRPVTPTESAQLLVKGEPLPFSETISRIGGNLSLNPDINDIINFGVMMTPGLVIDEEVKSVVGRRHKKILK
jgi:hypothetical protein